MRSGKFLSTSAMGTLVMLTGCAGIQDRSATAEEVVTERAEIRWASIVSGDLDDAYDMLTPARRTSMTPLSFKRQVLGAPIQWKGAEVIGAECTELVCTVSVKASMDINRPVPGVPRLSLKQRIEEKWILEGGEWWYVIE